MYFTVHVMLQGVVFNVFRVLGLLVLSNGYHRFSIVIRGVFNGYQGFSMVIGDFQWLSGVFSGYQRFSMVIMGFQWLPLITIENPQ